MEELVNGRLKRFIIIATPFMVFMLSVLVWTQFLKPLAVNFAIAQVPEINRMQNVVKISLRNLDLSLLKLQARADGVKVEVLDAHSPTKEVDIRSVTAQLDIFNLVIGRLNISKVLIEGATSTLEVRDSGRSKTEPPVIPVQSIFANSSNIPVDRIVLSDSFIYVKNLDLNKTADIKISKLTLINHQKELSLATENLQLSVTDENNNPPVAAQIDLYASANPSKLNINGLKVQVLESTVRLSAEFESYEQLLKNPVGRLELNSDLNLQDVRNTALVVFPQKTRIPAISGKITTKGQLQFNGLNDINGKISANTSQVVLEHFKLGQAELSTSINKNQLLINELSLEHPAGLVKLKNIKIEQKSPFHFNTRVEFSGFDLNKLFVSLGEASIPAGLNADGSAQCEGLIEPAPLVTCNVNTDMRNVWVKSDIKTSNYIIKLGAGRISGEAKITKEKFSYSANISLGKNSHGTSTGEVVFADGFNLHYDSPNLDFADVDSLAGLDLKGVVKIVGSTSGDSSHGVIDANVSAANAEIDKFRLGAFSSNLNYKAGRLLFTNLIGVVGKSDLAGALIFDFNKEELQAEINSNEIHGEDLLFILNKRFDLPFEFTGNGKAKASVSGPFDFWKLKYNLISEFRQGSIAGEHFDRLNADIASDGSQIEFRNVKAKKLKTSVVIDGVIRTQTSDPVFDLRVRTNPLQLEESDHVLAVAPSIAGIGYTDGVVTGPLSSPTFSTNFTLKQVSYDKVEYPNSQGKITIDKSYFKFAGQFFGRQIQSDLVWPWHQQDGFSAKILIQDLNPLFLLPLISLPQPGSDFYSRLNAEVDLTSKSGSFGTADGFIKISDLILQRGSQLLRLKRPSSLIFKSGINHLEEFELAGDESFLKVQMDKLAASRIRLNIDADLQLRLFHFLVPFAQTLAGNLTVKSQVSFKDGGFEMLGEGELIDGTIGMKGFPQTIENINTPVEFSKAKIYLSDITGQVGQSDLTGIGQIEILGSQNIAVNLRAIADNIKLNFPVKFLTQGKANVLFSGNWLPYNLKVDYKVNQGLVENDFEPDPKQNQTLKASSFLPPQQAQLLSPSLTLDINVDVSNGVLVKNKLLEGEAKGNIQVQGSPEQPVLLGKIEITPNSKLIFKDKPFDVQNASIQFQGTKEINPLIYITASSRVSDYDISLLVQGLAKSLKITPTSQPPLSQNDIFTLLALGVTNQANQSLSSDTQQKQTGLEVLAATVNQSQFNKKLQDRLGLTVQLAPSVDSTKNIAVPKVVVSKKITKKINASYSKPFTGNDQNQEVKLQYLYNNNVSFQLNYQNKESTQQEQITNSTNINKSILGLDLEYRDEFK